MSNLKKPLSPEENKALLQAREDGINSGHPPTVRQLAKMFGRNQSRILKELNLWKGVHRQVRHEPVIKLDPSSMDEVRKEYGSQ